MMRMRWRWRLATGLGLLAGCGMSDDSASFGPGGTGGVGSVTAGDGAAGGDDGPTDGDGGSDGAPTPETEDEGDFRVPRASGRWVYSASESSNSVAVIDSDTLAIEVVGVGRGPTVVAPLDESGHVAVLDQGSDDVALLTTSAGTTTVEIVPTS